MNCAGYYIVVGRVRWKMLNTLGCKRMIFCAISATFLPQCPSYSGYQFTCLQLMRPDGRCISFVLQSAPFVFVYHSDIITSAVPIRNRICCVALTLRRPGAAGPPMQQAGKVVWFFPHGQEALVWPLARFRCYNRK